MGEPQASDVTVLAARPAPRRARRTEARSSAPLPGDGAPGTGDRAGAARVEAVVLDWDETSAVVDPASLRPRVEALSAAGVQVVVLSKKAVDRLDAELSARPIGPGRVVLCLGDGPEVFELGADGPTAWASDRSGGELAEADRAGDVPRRWAGRWLAERGITGQLVMVLAAASSPSRQGLGRPAGGELARAVVVPLRRGGGGAWSGGAEVLERIDEQLRWRRSGRVPSIDVDPGWVIVLPQRDGSERVRAALTALGNGQVGARVGSGGGEGPVAPTLLVSGVYTAGGSGTRLLPGPCWCQLPSAPRTWWLDLRTGALAGGGAGPAGLRAFLFVSAARPFALALRAEAGPRQLERLGPVDRPDATTAFDAVHVGEVDVARTFAPRGGGIAVASNDRWGDGPGLRRVERLAAVSWAGDGRAARRTARDRLRQMEEAGFDALLAEHRATWAGRWAAAETHIEGAADDELAVRFALFHLLSSGPGRGEAAVGARGLTGAAYGGHVFWDADVFVLPAVAALRPDVARAMLEYRIRRLPPAREAARRQRRRGVRFPWESAADGTDVTPRAAPGPGGRLVAIRTGEHEEHIVADVAWAAFEYAAWTGDRRFLVGPGAPLVLETARYWASRARLDEVGRAHLYGVIGPDEYHEMVDDNAFTNVMARWNLRVAAALAEASPRRDVAPGEPRRWRRLADALVDGYDPDLGRHEQFAGYWRLEPLLAGQVGVPPFAADVVLGAERVRASQLIKQADVLMAHHLVPGELVDGSLARDLAFYEPRTVHGSSLSPAIHAALLARAHEPDRALEWFRLAARLDLDDLTGTTAGGLHLATFGGLWQALAYGFLGLRPHPGVLDLDPCLPSSWETVSIRFRFQGALVSLRVGHDGAHLSCSRPVVVRLPGGETRRCGPSGGSLQLGGGAR